MKNKRILNAYEKDGHVFIELDYTYFYSLKMAIAKSFKYGYNTSMDDYYDVIDIEDELSKVKGSWTE